MSTILESNVNSATGPSESTNSDVFGAIWEQLVTRDTDARVEHCPQLYRTAGGSWAEPLWLFQIDQGWISNCPSPHGIAGSSTPCTSGAGWLFRQRSLSLPGLPLSLDSLRLIGGGPLGAYDHNAMETLMTSLSVGAGNRDVPDAILLEEFCEAIPHDEWIGSIRAHGYDAIDWQPSQPMWIAQLPANEGDFWKRFKSKTRYNLKRDCRRLEHETRHFHSVDDVERFLGDAEEICRQSWQGERLGVRMQNTDEQRANLSRLASLGALRSSVLYQDEKPIAFAHGTCWNGRYCLEETSYVQDYRSQRPGIVLLLDLMLHLIENENAFRFEFGFGDGAYKQLLGDSQTPGSSILLLPSGPKSFAIQQWLAARESMRRCVKSVRSFQANAFKHSRRANARSTGSNS